MKPGTRVKIIDSRHSAYGRVGTVTGMAGQDPLVKLDYKAETVAVSVAGLRRVKLMGDK